MSNHTAGPWRWVIQDHSMASLVGKDEEMDHVMSVSPCKSCTEHNRSKKFKYGLCLTPNEANARLIAAAPSLLKALMSLSLSVKAHPHYTGEENDEWTDIIETAEKAIRLATKEYFTQPPKERTMEREIKFRGKIKDNQEWVYGSYMNRAKSKHQIVSEGQIFPFTVEKESVGQFTGLYDKNETPIYEGDVLAIPELYETPEMVSARHINWEVIFFNGAYNIKNNFSPNPNDQDNLPLVILAYDGNVEVIGNIHQNPELLSPTK